MVRRFGIALCLVAGALAGASAQSDLDALMERVLARRDDNWKKLQQYVVEERETFQLVGPGDQTLYGFQRDYLWFPRDGRFIKSPVAADGVAIGEDERRRQEARWLWREEQREKRRAAAVEAAAAKGEPATTRNGVSIAIGPSGVDVGIQTAMREALEPGFVSAAYFLNFKFDPGQYALVGRERFEDRDVLRVEYYPTRMFTEGRTRPNKELRERDKDVERKMNKVSLVTLWIDPAEHQIVRYEFSNIDLDFLPAQWFVRVDGMTAAMEMGRPFPGIWLPRAVRIGFDMSLANGQVDGRYSSEYHDYRLASVETRVKPGAP
jgi:hypothetical protein